MGSAVCESGFLNCLGKFQVPGGERSLLGKNSESRAGWLDQDPGHFFSSVPGKAGAGGTTPLTPWLPDSGCRQHEFLSFHFVLREGWSPCCQSLVLCLGQGGAGGVPVADLSRRVPVSLGHKGLWYSTVSCFYHPD